MSASSSWPCTLIQNSNVQHPIYSHLFSCRIAYAASLFRELDYRTEAANGARFAELYAHLEVGRYRVQALHIRRGWCCVLCG